MMKAVVLHGSVDHPLSPSQSHYMMITNPSIIHQSFISRPFENVFPSNIHSIGLLPPPPLLPRPAAHHRRSNSIRGPSCPPPSRNSDRTTPPKLKKSKSPTKIQEKKSPKRSSHAYGMTSSSTNPLGYDPKDSPKNVPEVFPSDSMGSKYGTSDTGTSIITESLGRLGSGVFIISPPPSSLPLPTFSLRPKPQLRC